MNEHPVPSWEDRQRRFVHAYNLWSEEARIVVWTSGLTIRKKPTGEWGGGMLTVPR